MEWGLGGRRVSGSAAGKVQSKPLLPCTRPHSPSPALSDACLPQATECQLSFLANPSPSQAAECQLTFLANVDTTERMGYCILTVPLCPPSQHACMPQTAGRQVTFLANPYPTPLSPFPGRGAPAHLFGQCGPRGCGTGPARPGP